ncbi:DNA-directed RNA polymerases II and V subunit 8A [Porphyridium purpureum]|uniref:DNA-directed RNA polymerases II and V subunit 8A n=1 Tax=Porphyridium purpureum TaxID=35688 RepID=A0A5J4Z7V1_PORPP|nr:DNA-directed RNA polymerases II and V subunit 8A [Porphyridium purpureum]|eukprot:POR6193..scf295_1
MRRFARWTSNRNSRVGCQCVTERRKGQSGLKLKDQPRGQPDSACSLSEWSLLELRTRGLVRIRGGRDKRGTMVKVFEDTFTVNSIDKFPDPKDPSRMVYEKKFDKTSRISMSSDSKSAEMVLDVNTEIYPVKEGELYTLALADSLDTKIGRESESSLLEEYQYAMYGKIYHYAEERNKAVVYVSFGGLLMSLAAAAHTLNSRTFEVDTEIYLLMSRLDG